VNKMDNPGANYERVAQMLKEKLGHHPVCLQVPIGAEDKFAGIIDAITGIAYYFDGQDGEKIREEAPPAEYVEQVKKARALMVEKVADVDDTLAEKFLAEEPSSNEELKAAIRRATLALKMTPVMCGSAVKNKGVQLLLDAVLDFCPTRPRSSTKATIRTTAKRRSWSRATRASRSSAWRSSCSRTSTGS